MAERRRLVIRGGTVVDATGSRRADMAVEDATIVAVAEAIEPARGDRVLDAGGCVVAPGLVDLHTHLRQPGMEEAETIESGARAAALGGFTALTAMPNTSPAIDCASAVREVLDLGSKAMAEIRVAGAITVGRMGERLAPMAEMAELGVRIFTDDGAGVQDPRLMRRAMQYSTALGATIAEHCEDAALAAGGQMHEGEWSGRLGVPGIPSEAEEVMAARDVMLARATGARLHLLHVSTAGTVAIVRAAKAAGIAVSAEATPHHLCLTDASLECFDTVFKVNPPLRSASDVEELCAGLADGTLDAVATDHAPHPQQAKEAPLDEAPPGVTGLETALAVALTELHVRRGMPLQEVLGLLSWAPARIAGVLGRHGGPLAAGGAANLVVLDPAATWVVRPEELASRSRNTPFAGRSLTGRVRHTVLEGEAVVLDGEAQR